MKVKRRTVTGLKLSFYNPSLGIHLKKVSLPVMVSFHFSPMEYFGFT